MRRFLLITILLLSGCAKHASIDYLYPEFAGQFVTTTNVLYLKKVVHDNQINHPDYVLIIPSIYNYKINLDEVITLPVGTELFLDGFYTHNRFTENGTEVMGWVNLSNRQIKFFAYLNTSYNGLKKVENLPWNAISNITIQ